MSAYAFDNKKKLQRPISVEDFHGWTKNNFYRTSYGTHYTDLPAPPKNVASPGYAGFVPFMKSSNLYGQSYSPITRNAFSNSNLGVNRYNLASTGFNFTPKVHIDESKKALSHKYGSQTIPKFHPCLNTEQWETQSQSTFKHPKSLLQPTYRVTDRFLQTAQAATKHSGFEQNHSAFDGTGWVPNPILNGDQVRTEYRIQYNKEKPFHREPTSFKLRKIRNNEQNYKHT